MLAALEDDVNTPEAIADLFGLVKEVNKATETARKRALAEQLRAGAWLLGLLTQDPASWFGTGAASGSGDDAEIDSLVKQRDALKRQRNFKEADRIRDQLTARGIVIEDTPQGARWRRGR
jgi:cysteinyl-tRNA synthetase